MSWLQKSSDTYTLKIYKIVTWLTSLTEQSKVLVQVQEWVVENVIFLKQLQFEIKWMCSALEQVGDGPV